MKSMIILSFLFASAVHAAPVSTSAAGDDAVLDFMEDFDPNSPNAEQILEQYDRYYEENTGLSAHLPGSGLIQDAGGCYRNGCSMWADVNKSTQRLNLYEGGQLIATWKTSTGIDGRNTPDFDKNPDGRIYQKFSSTKYPGGDWNGLGNMPYAVFIYKGWAIHGTPAGNWSKLGRQASHGCIRIHPNNAAVFNQMVRHYGIGNVWISVHD